MNRAALAATFLLAACSHDPGKNGSGGGEGGIVDAAPLRTDWTPEQLKAACEEAQKTCDAKLAKIAGLRDAERTFANPFVGRSDPPPGRGRRRCFAPTKSTFPPS